MREEFAVLRFVEQGAGCHVVMAREEGEIFGTWIRYHPNISREQLFRWIYDIIRQLEFYHRCRKGECYRYVNPYSFVLTDGQELCLLDVRDRTNDSAVRRMNRRGIRICFEPQESETTEQEREIYGLGKTIQYLLAHTDVEPALTKIEERHLKKLIQKCLCAKYKKKDQSLTAIQKEFSNIQSVCSDNSFSLFKLKSIRKKKAALILCVLALLLMVVSGTARCGRTDEGEENRISDTEEKSEEEKSAGEAEKEQEQLYFAMGFTQFVELKNYDRSSTFFHEIAGQNVLAGYYAAMADYMAGRMTYTEAEMLEILAGAERLMPKEPEYYLSLIRVYARIGEEEEHLIRLGEYYLGLDVWKEEREVRAYLAAAYEKSEEYDKASGQYQALIGQEQDDARAEELYIRLVRMYEKAGQKEEAQTVCTQGTKRLPYARRLHIVYLEICCQNTGNDSTSCAQVISEVLRRIPEIKESEEFQKLQQEYKITIEGENVWVGK